MMCTHSDNCEDHTKYDNGDQINRSKSCIDENAMIIAQIKEIGARTHMRKASDMRSAGWSRRW